MAERRTPHSLWPQLCRVPTLLELVLLGEALALVLALLAPAGGSFWFALGLNSLFIQWVGLLSLGLLCLLHRSLQGLSPARAALLALCLLVGLTALVSELSYRLELLPVQGHGPFLLRNTLAAALLGAVALYYSLRQQRWRAQLLGLQQGRLAALQARIQPHFLFNSLNTIASLIPLRPQQAEGLLEDLAALLRGSLGGSRPLHSLEDELALTRSYLNIEQQRLGPRLRVRWQQGALPALQLPPLLLQPLVENAVRHGIEPLSEGGEVGLLLERRGQELYICIDNPLAPATARPGLGMALANVEERLQAAFGERARLWRHDDGLRHRLELWLPLAEEGR